MTKKQLDTLSVLEAQLESAQIRLSDPYHQDQKEWILAQIEKIQEQINRIRK
jgi:hypothetical protein